MTGPGPSSRHGRGTGFQPVRSPLEDGRHSRPARARPRAVLGWVVLAILVAGGLHAVAPWILPVRILEGPMVQMAGPDAVTLVWFTTRPAECAVAVRVGDAEQIEAASVLGCRHHVRVAGLTPGTRYAYEVRGDQRPLTTDRAFQTNVTADERYSFLVFGDSGNGSRAQYLLAARMLDVQPPPDFVLHTGDLVYMDGARRRYEERFFAPYRALLARVAFWPSLGNHDIEKESREVVAFGEVFELPANGPPGVQAGRNYWFDYASCRVAVLDSNLDEKTLAEEVAPWLNEVLANPGPRWRFACFHHPPYTGGKYRPDATIQRAIVPVLDATGVDVVFNGHDHMYERTHPLRGGQIVEPGQGVVYIVSAAGGGKLYEPVNPRPDDIAVLHHQTFSFTHVMVDGDELTLRQIDLDGGVLDEFTLQKPPVQRSSSAGASSGAVVSPGGASIAPARLRQSASNSSPGTS